VKTQSSSDSWERMRARKDQNYVYLLKAVRKRTNSLKHCLNLLSRRPFNFQMRVLLSSRKSMCYLVNNLCDFSPWQRNPVFHNAFDTIDGCRIHSSYLRQQVIDQTTVPSGSSGGSLSTWRKVAREFLGFYSRVLTNMVLLTKGASYTIFDIFICPIESERYLPDQFSPRKVL
jgi:hypothetical protein